MTNKSEAIRVNVDPATKTELERRAASEDVPVAQLIRRAIRMLLAATLLTLIVAPSATATLRMYGDVKPRHWNWAAAAQQNMPLPNTRISLWLNYDPIYIDASREMYIPQAGREGWDYKQERYVFLHELGHVRDHTGLTASDRKAFLAATVTTALGPVTGYNSAGWVKKVSTWNWRNSTAVQISPREMFAETYAACALGLTRIQSDSAQYVSYGWQPPVQVDQVALCDVVQILGA